MYLINIKRHYAFKSVFIVLGLLLSIQCKTKPEEQAAQTSASAGNTVTLSNAQLKNAPIETVQLSKKNIATVLKLNGKVDVPPSSMVSVSMPLGGYLKTTKLLPGMQVRKGDVIAIMQDPQYIRLQQDYLQTKSKLHFAELDYKRQGELNQSQASSDKVMQQAQADMNSQRITLNALAQQLRLISINPERLNENTITKDVRLLSPINGFVSKVNVNIGRYVNPADVLFELIDPSDIHLNLKVYEKDINKLAIGQKLFAYSNSEPGKKYEGRILLISQDIDKDGTSEAHCHFSQYDKSLLPGTYMNAEIETLTSLSFALPEESIVNFEGQDYVFVQTQKQRFDMVPVTTGDTENGFVHIVNHEGFTGKNIVTKNAYTLLMKLKNTEEE